MRESRPASLSWFIGTTIKFTPVLAELMVIGCVARLIGLIEPFVFQTLIDRVLPFQRAASIQLIVVILIATTLFSATLGVLSALLAAQTANRLTSAFGKKIYTHVLDLTAAHLQRFQVGATLARLREIDTVRTFLTESAIGLLLDLTFAFVYVAALLALSPHLTLIVLFMLPLQMAAFGLIGPFLRSRMQENFLAGSAHQSRLVEVFGNPITVKALVSEQLHVSRLSDSLDDTLQQSWCVTKLGAINDFLIITLRGLTVVLIIFYGTKLVFASQMTLGQLIAFHLLAQNIITPLLSLSQIWEKWQRLRLARIRLGDFLNEQSERACAKPRLPAATRPQLAAESIRFGYGGKELFSKLSLSFASERINVIVGESGCGKSTLARILSGLYAPWSGRVLFAGRDIRDFDPASIRRRIGYVAQDPVLFSGTVVENLKLANSEATSDQIEKALELSAAADFVDLLPSGVETQVGERGGSLSGGQRQRIALARSLIANPDVLIVDEPTGGLHEDAAALIMTSLAKLAASKTIILITHRPELIVVEKRIINLSGTGTDRLRAA